MGSNSGNIHKTLLKHGNYLALICKTEILVNVSTLTDSSMPVFGNMRLTKDHKWMGWWLQKVYRRQQEPCRYPGSPAPRVPGRGGRRPRRRGSKRWTKHTAGWCKPTTVSKDQTLIGIAEEYSKKSLDCTKQSSWGRNEKLFWLRKFSCGGTHSVDNINHKMAFLREAIKKK